MMDPISVPESKAKGQDARMKERLERLSCYIFSFSRVLLPAEIGSNECTVFFV